jgi:hypothetical protein
MSSVTASGTVNIIIFCSWQLPSIIISSEDINYVNVQNEQSLANKCQLEYFLLALLDFNWHFASLPA